MVHLKILKRNLLLFLFGIIFLVSGVFAQGSCRDCDNLRTAGDANNDCNIDISDARFILNSLFNTGSPFCNGGYYYVHADANGDARVNLADSVYILRYLFSGGPAPVALPSNETNVTAICGNNIREAGEECDDGNRIDGDGCSSLCRIEVGNETNVTAICGNNIREGNEMCDGRDLAGQTCRSLGFDDGVLSCKTNCNFDTGNCFNLEENVTEENKTILDCRLSSATWDVQNAVVGSVVGLTVIGKNCDGQIMSFEVREDDALVDDPVKVNPQNAKFIGGIARSEWVVEDQFDGLFGGEPEYYFIGRLVSDEIRVEILSGNKLQVVKETVAGGGGLGLANTEAILDVLGENGRAWYCGEVNEIVDVEGNVYGAQERGELRDALNYVEEICGD